MASLVEFVETVRELRVLLEQAYEKMTKTTVETFNDHQLAALMETQRALQKAFGHATLFLQTEFQQPVVINYTDTVRELLVVLKSVEKKLTNKLSTSASTVNDDQLQALFDMQRALNQARDPITRIIANF